MYSANILSKWRKGPQLIERILVIYQQLHSTGVHSWWPSDLLASLLSSLHPATMYGRFWLITVSKTTYLRRNSGTPTKAVGFKAFTETHSAILDSSLLQLALVLTEEACLMFYPDLICEGSEPWILMLLTQ